MYIVPSSPDVYFTNLELVYTLFVVLICLYFVGRS